MEEKEEDREGGGGKVKLRKEMARDDRKTDRRQKTQEHIENATSVEEREKKTKEECVITVFFF